MNQPNICDFWIYWKRFARLNFVQGNNQNVVWTNCNLESAKEGYTWMFFGFNIGVWKKKFRKRDLKKIEKIKEERGNQIKALHCSEEMKKNLICNIWHFYVDLDWNLQCIQWTKTYWFYWLIRRIFNYPKCPNCKTEITKDKIQPNIEWKKYTHTSEVESKNALWKNHQKEWMFFWVEWWSYICNKWIVSKIHNDHKVIENQDVVELLQYKLNSKLSENQSARDKLRKWAEEESLSNEINLKTIDEAVNLMSILALKMRNEIFTNNDLKQYNF